MMSSASHREFGGSAVSEANLSASESVRQISGGSAANVSMINEMAGKLDIMMHVFFSFLQVHMDEDSLLPSAGSVGRDPASAASYDSTQSDSAPLTPAQERQRALERRHKLFDLLMRVFEDSVLNTYRSKYVQFIVFFACKFDSAYVELFVSRMLGRMLHPQMPCVTKRACASYVASFLSRARFVKPMAICSALHHMLNWAQAYILSRESKESQLASALSQQHQQYFNPNGGAMDMLMPGDKSHEAFYSICQACFYIICFLGKHLENTGNSDAVGRGRLLTLLRELPWIRVVFSRLDPLMYCLETVRREFMSVAKATRLLGSRRKEIDIHLAQMEITGKLSQGGGVVPVAPATGRVDTPQAARGGGGTGGGGRANANASGDANFVMGNDNPLDSFFPFDPYLLRLSSVHVDSIYVEWNGGSAGRMPTAAGDLESVNCYEDDEDMGGMDTSGGGRGGVTQAVIDIPQPRQRANSFFAEAEDTAFGSGDFFSPEWCDDSGMHENVDGATPMSIGRSISPDTNDLYLHKTGPDASSFARPRVVSGAGSW